uniref:Uncharacterized protein n=1 Tax=Arundo donax TaxID=35708 RepID=A0A0A9C1S1_ARUDO
MTFNRDEPPVFLSCFITWSHITTTFQEQPKVYSDFFAGTIYCNVTWKKSTSPK